MNSAPELFLKILYLLVYAAAAAGLFLPLMSGGRYQRDQLLVAGRFLQILCLTGIIPSLQVLLDAVGITGSLRSPWPDLLTLFFNTLILTGIWFCVRLWYLLAGVFNPVRFRPDFLLRPFNLALLSLLILNLIIQAMALVFHRAQAMLAVPWSLAAFFLVTVLYFLGGVIRIYHPREKREPGLRALQLIPPAVISTGLLSLLPLPEAVSGAVSLLPPLVLLAVFSLSFTAFLLQSRVMPESTEARNQFFSRAGLTPREQEIAVLLAQGLSYKEISSRLFISLSTMQTHVGRIYGKTGVNSKTELSVRLKDLQRG